MIFYIAGKIFGDEKYREKFSKAAAYFADLDIENSVLNPAELPEGMMPIDYMTICITMLMRSDVVVLLPDAAESKGAMIEKAIAEYVGKTVYQMSEEEI